MVVVESSILWTAATRWTVRDWWMDGQRFKLVQVLTAAPMLCCGHGGFRFGCRLETLVAGTKT